MGVLVRLSVYGKVQVCKASSPLHSPVVPRALPRGSVAEEHGQASGVTRSRCRTTAAPAGHFPSLVCSLSAPHVMPPAGEALPVRSEEEHSTLGDTLGGAARALFRGKAALRAVRVKGKTAAKALDRLATAGDLADSLPESRTVSRSTVVTAARTYATAFGLGTLLFAVQEAALERTDSHAGAGAIAGAVHGTVAHTVSAVNQTGTSSFLRALPRAAATDCAEYGVLFGSYAAVRRRLLKEPLEEARRDEFTAHALLSVLGAGGVAGALQNAVSQVLRREAPFTLLAVAKASPLSAIGFAAYETGNALAHHD